MKENNTFPVHELAINTTTITMDSEVSTGAGTAGKPPFLPWNNPDMIISFEAMMTTANITNLVISPLLLVIGAPTNLISCVVFYKQGLRDRMNLSLFVLGLVDAAFLAASFVVGFYGFITLWDKTLGEKYMVNGVVWLLWAMSGMKLSSGCITMVVAVERCVCVVFPLRANTMMKTRTMRALLAATVLLPNLGETVMCFNYKVIDVYDEAFGLTSPKLTVTDFFMQHPIIYEAIHDIALNFLLPLVTFLVVGVATAITVIQLQTAIAWRTKTATSGKGDNHNQQQQTALTKMLVILSCVYMVCSAPLVTHSIVRFSVPDFSSMGRYSNFFYATAVISAQIFAPVNSTVNFFVYYFRSTRFRSELRALWCCGNSKEKSNVDKAESTTTVTSFTDS